MTYLKIYGWEQTTYADFYRMTLNSKDTYRYIRKIARHFKVSEPNVRFSERRWRGAYDYYSATIFLRSNPDLGVVIHEMAHHIATKSFGECGHDKRFKRCLKKAYTFAKRYLPTQKPAV